MKNNFFNSVINRGFNGGRTGVGAPVTDTCSSHGLIGSISVVETTVKHQSLSFRRVAMLLFVILLSIGNMWGTIVTYSFSATEIKAGTTKGTVTVSMKGCTDKTGDPQQICKDGSTKVKEGVIQIANTAGTSWDDKCVVISSTSVIESFNVHGAPNTDASKKYAVIGWKGTPSATFDGKTTLTLPSRANACSDAYSGEITPLDADSKKTIKNVRIYRQVKVSATKFEGSSTLGDGQTGQIADISVTVNEIPTSCTVTFYKNDGTDATATQTNITPSTPTSLRTLSDIDWSRTGYDFDGWAESASGDAVYEDGGSITLTSNKDLYAHWTAKTYDITLDANGGAADGSATVVYDGGVTSYTPATPAGEGQTLLGYFSATTGGNKIIDALGALVADKWTDTKTNRLYAQWATSCTVRFMANGSAFDTQTVGLGGNATTPEGTPEAPQGKGFGGWSETDGGAAVDVESITINGNKDFYAVWNDLRTVSFATGCNASTIDPVTVIDGQPVAKPADPTRTNWEITKWQLEGADYNFDSPVTSDIELTAVWQRKTISGSSEDFTLIDGTSVKSVLSSEWKYSTKTANNHVKFAGGMNGESDSRFITFVIPEGKTGKVKNATIHSSNIFVIIPESQVTEATRTFDYSNPYFSLTGSGKTEKDATVNNDMPAGKYYCGSTKSSLEISKLVITVSTAPITATFKDGEATKYAVSATANEELGNLFLDCELPVLADHDGMKFRGWYNGENPVAKTTTISASTTYTAKWQGEEHTLTWAIGEGTIKTPGTPAGQVEAGTPLTAPVVEREGYRFDGWNPEVPPVMPNDDAEYVAQWVKVYTVTYMNGTTTLGTETVDKGQKASEYTSYQNQPLATFQGWFDAATEGNAINFATKTIDDDLTAYGKWDKAYAQTANFVAAATGTKPNISTFLSGLNYAISSMDNVSWDDQPSAQADRGLKIEKSGTTLSFWVAADKCVKIKVGTLEGVDKGTAGVSVDGGASYETIYGADPQGTGEPKEYTYTTTEETLFVIKINNGCPGTGGVYQWNLIQSISITGSTPHNITLNPATNGSFTVKGLTEKVTAVEGENVALVAIPASGYMLDKWSVYKTDEEATKVTVTGNSFVMPAYAVTVSATFKEKDDYATTIDFMALADENYSKTTTPEHTANIETELSNHHYILSSMTNVSWDKPDGKPADKGLKIKNSGTTIAFDVAAKKLVVLTMGSIKNNSAKFSVDGGANYTNLVGSNPQSTGASVVTYYYSDNERTYMYATNSGDYNVIQAITITDPYKVTFANGGEIDPMYFKGTALELPAATGEGEFQGWYDAETEGKLIGMAGDKFSPASDITLYAHFVSEDADNSLAWLKYGDTDITLVPNQVEYNVTLPHDSNLPIVTYEANSEKATAGEVTQATAQTMKATFTVTAENGDEANYSVVFEYEKVLTAMAAGSYAKAVIAPASVSGTSSQYAAGLSDNAYFNTLGDASKKDGEAGTPEFKNEYIYLKGQAQMSGAIPTSRAIQFIIGTRGKLTISGKGDMRMIKEGETEAAVIGTTTAGDYEVSVLPGTYYIYATDGSRNITNIKYEIPPMGTDATLKSLKVAGYALTPEFDAETTDYSVVLDYGTTELPNVLFEKNDEFASVVKTDAESVTGTTTIEVTAEDGTTVKTYSIAFSVSTDPKFVIFDGSKMTDFGPRTFTDPVSGMSWEVGSSLSYNKNNDALSCGAKDYAHDLKMQPAKEKDGKAIRINVPEGKVCIINLVGCTGSSGNLRSVFIAKSDQAGVEDALIAYTSDQYVLEKKSIKVLGGSYYVRADASCRFYEISVEISDYDYSRSGSGYATLCLPYDVKVANTLGATFYEADYKDESVHQMYFNELDENATLNAGQAYLFYYTARTAYFVYEPETSPADEIDARGFYGVLEDTYVSYTTEGEVWHGVYGTKIQPMAEGVLIPANRAYINLSEVPTVTKVPAGMAAPRRLAFGTPRSQTTDNEQLLMNAENGVMKVIMNNHMFIFRDGKKFNAIGAPMR